MKYGIAVTCLTVGMMLAITACGGKKAESTETAAQTAVVVETQTETETETAQESELTLTDDEQTSTTVEFPKVEIESNKRSNIAGRFTAE